MIEVNWGYTMIMIMVVVVVDVAVVDDQDDDDDYGIANNSFINCN